MKNFRTVYYIKDLLVQFTPEGFFKQQSLNVYLQPNLKKKKKKKKITLSDFLTNKITGNRKD